MKLWHIHLRGSRTQGDVLHLSPRWTHWTYWFLVLVSVAGLSIASSAASMNMPRGLPSSAMKDGPW